MQYAFFAVGFCILFIYAAWLHRKLYMMKRDVEDRFAETALQVKSLSETVKSRDRQEQMVLDGMNNILNYSIGHAIKAVSGNEEA